MIGGIDLCRGLTPRPVTGSMITRPDVATAANLKRLGPSLSKSSYKTPSQDPAGGRWGALNFACRSESRYLPGCLNSKGTLCSAGRELAEVAPNFNGTPCSAQVAPAEAAPNSGRGHARRSGTSRGREWWCGRRRPSHAGLVWTTTATRGVSRSGAVLVDGVRGGTSSGCTSWASPVIRRTSASLNRLLRRRPEQRGSRPQPITYSAH